MYQSFKSEYLDLCQKFGRDTNRKIKNDLKKDAIELADCIKFITPKIEEKGFCYLYGEIQYRKDLKKYIQELEYTNQLLNEL